MSDSWPGEAPGVERRAGGAPPLAGRERQSWTSPLVQSWLALGALISVTVYLGYLVEGRSVPWQGLAVWYATWVLWIPLGFGLYQLVLRFPVERGRWRARGGLYAAGALVTAAVLLLLRLGLERLLLLAAGAPGSAFRLRAVQIESVVYDLFVFWAVVAVCHAVDLHRRSAQREVRNAVIEAQLASTQLRFLRAQLHPHFLFNSLHMISALLHEDPDRADRMLTELSDLLRLSLENAERQEVPLAQELAFVERYLAIARERFGPRLAVRTEVAPEALTVAVPNLILQPLVENAIQHGVAPAKGTVTVTISATRRGGALRLAVEDDGRGLDAGARPTRDGIGLANTRSRLAQLYGDMSRLELSARPGGGTVAAVEVPWPEAAEQGEELIEEVMR